MEIVYCKGKEDYMSSITIKQKGILDIPADAIVNAANSGLRAGAVCAA